jgi:septal ring factor EnvC (AmiA/AmiB activator)
MVESFKYLALTFLFVITFSLFPQEEQIQQKQFELSDLKDEISKLENDLAEKSKKEIETFNTLENYNRQSYLINKLISSLREDERLKQKEIEKVEREVKILVGEIEILKENYSKYVVAIYKKGFFNELESIINAQSKGK